MGTLHLGGLRRGLAAAKGQLIPGALQTRASEQQVQQENRTRRRSHTAPRERSPQNPRGTMYTEARAQPLLERQGNPGVAGGAGPCNREQVPRGKDVRWQKAQTAPLSPGTTRFPRTLRLPEPFRRPRGQRLPAATNTHKGRTRAGLRHPGRLARRASAGESGTPRPLKLGAGVRRLAGRAALTASAVRFYGGGAWGCALAGGWEGVTRDASWSCICTTSHPLYLGDNAYEARRDGGEGALGIERGSGTNGPPWQVAYNLLPHPQ